MTQPPSTVGQPSTEQHSTTVADAQSPEPTTATADDVRWLLKNLRLEEHLPLLSLQHVSPALIIAMFQRLFTVELDELRTFDTREHEIHNVNLFIEKMMEQPALWEWLTQAMPNGVDAAKLVDRDVAHIGELLFMFIEVHQVQLHQHAGEPGNAVPNETASVADTRIDKYQFLEDYIEGFVDAVQRGEADRLSASSRAESRRVVGSGAAAGGGGGGPAAGGSTADGGSRGGPRRASRSASGGGARTRRGVSGGRSRPTYADPNVRYLATAVQGTAGDMAAGLPPEQLGPRMRRVLDALGGPELLRVATHGSSPGGAEGPAHPEGIVTSHPPTGTATTTAPPQEQHRRAPGSTDAITARRQYAADALAFYGGVRGVAAARARVATLRNRQHDAKVELVRSKRFIEDMQAAELSRRVADHSALEAERRRTASLQLTQQRLAAAELRRMARDEDARQRQHFANALESHATARSTRVSRVCPAVVRASARVDASEAIAASQQNQRAYTRALASWKRCNPFIIDLPAHAPHRRRIATVRAAGLGIPH